MLGRVLIIAGSDSGGGAGIQADLKTVTALGGYGATAITALTAQNTEGVHAIFEVDPDFVRQQISVVLSDIGADCIKTGMLHRAEVIEAVVETIAEFAPDAKLVVDPVMVAKGGHALLQSEALDALKSRLLPLADVLTPNIPEAEALTGISISTVEHMQQAATAICALGPKAVLVKGGHLAGDTLSDVLVERDGEPCVFEGARIDTRHTHGTGCTTASAIATGLAQGMELKDAVARARAYVFEAIRTAPRLGKGHGPLNHGHTVAPFKGR